MSALLPGSPLVLTLGWTLLLSVWQTALIALLVWGGMRAARLASPALRHRLAMSGLVLALLCAAATFVWLARASVTPSPRVAERSRALNAAGGETVDALAPLALNSSREPQRNATLGSLLPARLVAWAGVVWLVAAAALGIRALGGMLVVWRMRRRATPLRSTALREAAASLAQRMGLRRPVALLESSEIEAPAALGLWRGALVFPQDLESSLAGEHVEPIVVHELEHLRQRWSRLHRPRSTPRSASAPVRAGCRPWPAGRASCAATTPLCVCAATPLPMPPRWERSRASVAVTRRHLSWACRASVSSRGFAGF